MERDPQKRLACNVLIDWYTDKMTDQFAKTMNDGGKALDFLPIPSGESTCEPIATPPELPTRTSEELQQCSWTLGEIKANGCFGSGYKKEYGFGAEELTSADYIAARSFSVGSTPIVAVCHTDGSGQDKAATQVANVIASTFLETIPEQLSQGAAGLGEVSKAVLNSAMEAHKAAIASRERGFPAPATACGYLLLPAGNHQLCVGFAIGDVDLFHQSGHVTKNKTAGGRGFAFDMVNPGGQLGRNPNFGPIPDLSNLRLFAFSVVPGDRIITCSDGISDNLQPAANCSTPGEAIEEMRRWGEEIPEHWESLKGERGTKAPFADRYTETTEELIERYQEAALGRGVEEGKIEDSALHLVETAALRARSSTEKKTYTVEAEGKERDIRLPTNEEGRVVKSDDLSCLLLEVPKVRDVGERKSTPPPPQI